MQVIQDIPLIINESYIERIAERQIPQEQFPDFSDVYENNKFHTKFKLVEYIPERKNSKKTIFFGLLKNYPNGMVEIPSNIFKEGHEYNIRIISPLGNTTYSIPNEVIPEKIKDSPKKKQTLTFSFFNDNTGIPILDKILSGDDMGYTYGLKISYGVDFKKNHLNIDYLTNLYTRKRIDLPTKFSDDGHIFFSQDFVDEVLFIATLDNKKQANPLYQDYSLGFLHLNSYDDDFFLTASAQQKIWHDFLSNFVDIFLIDNQKIESVSQSGVVFGFHEGLYLPVRLCDWLHLSMDLKIGGRLSTIPHTNYFDFVTSADLTYKKKQKSLIAKLNFGSNMMLHDKGLRTILSLGSSIGTESFQFGINFLKPFGDSFQIYKFDDKREESYDLIGETFIKFGF